MKSISRSFLLRLSLTVLALAAAMHLGIPKLAIRPADAISTCANTECHGAEMCRYAPKTVCALSSKTGPCTASWCE